MPDTTLAKSETKTNTPVFDFPQFDSDSHVQEAGGTWELYLAEEFKDRRPQVLDNPYVSQRPQRNKTWYIDGRLIPKNQGNGGVVMSTPAEMDFAKAKPVPVDIQSCADAIGRAAYMQREGISRSVLYSTLFLDTLTDDLVYEAALMRAWNDWMSDVCAKTNVLSFAGLVPTRDPRLAVQELRHAHEKGAVAAMILPTAGERMLHDPVLDPFWAEAERLNLPVSIHIGWPNPRVTNECTTPSTIFLGAFDLSVWWAYISVFTGGILDRFPKLKIAFIEHDTRFFELFMIRANHWYPTSVCRPWPAKKSPEDYLRDHQIYFAFEGDYAGLPAFMDRVGEDRVMGAFDFPHTHYGVASLSIAYDFMRNHEHLSPQRKRKLLHDNTAAYYGFRD